MENDLIRGLKSFVKAQTSVPIMLAKVDAVGTDTIDVTTINDDEVFDVRLQAIADGNTEGVIVKPKLNSWVIIADIGDKEHDYVVVAFEAVSEINVKMGTLRCNLTQDGLRFTKGSKDLKSILNGFIDAVKNLKVISPNGIVSSVLPAQIPIFESIKADLNQLLR